MKPHYQPLTTILLAFTLLCGLSSYSNAQQATWKITSLEWEPYSSSSMNNSGNAIQHLRSMLAQCGIELQVEFYPWRRAKEIAGRDGYLGYFPAWPDGVNEGFVASDPVDYSGLALLALAGTTIETADLEQLFAQHSVGLVNSYVYPAELRRLMDAYPDNTYLGATSDQMLLKMLLAKRFDLAVTDPTVLQYLADRDGTGQIKIVKALPDLPLVIAMRNTAQTRQQIALTQRLLQRQTRKEPLQPSDCEVR
ncbi:transporter substrate-binding domain-containing protein [Pseudomonas sp.]|uniref:substrate-binding periplasmic protein n=1 Tax=Pseudomonas sp. TaxID=306 RepID=UPI003242A661